ncbi:MAG: hypothetical protein RKO66_05025 [Candidatus Contendobacter sp.]|nr:hypothetical protein [Candidatus Contendobacter sp.]
MVGAVRRLAAEMERRLRKAHPTPRKMVATKLALAVGAMIEA